MKTINVFCFLLLFPLAVLGGPTFTFDVFTDNGQYSDSSDWSYTVNVQDQNNDYVLLQFANIGSINSVISSIYFEDSQQIINIDDITLSSDDVVNFSIDNKPGNLPSGENLNPDFITFFSIGANPPPYHNGIEINENLNMLVQIDGGYESLLNSISNGQTRIGLHVIGFPDGSSESAVIRVVPEPTSALLFICGITGLFIARKKINEK